MDTTDSLQAMMDQARQRQRTLSWRRRGLGVLWPALAALLAIVLLDAVTSLPPAARLLLAMTLAAGCLGAWRSSRRTPVTSDLQRLQRIERFHGLDDNALINAWSLAPGAAAAGDDLQRALAGRAREHGCRVAARTDPQAAVDDPAWRWHAGRLAMVVALWAVVTLAAPALPGIGLVRLTMPWADQPPFSLTQLHVTVNPQPLHEGHDAVVRAEWRGIDPRQAELVELDEHGREVRRWPMSPMPVPAFVRTLEAVREPIRVRVQTPTGYSRMVRIDPSPALAQASPPPPPTPEAAPPSDAREQASSASSPDASASAEQLAQQARDIQQVAERTIASADDVVGQSRSLQDLQDALQAFAADVRAMQEAAASDGPTRDLLGDLQLPRLPRMPRLSPSPQLPADPSPGMVSQGPTEQVARWARQVSAAAGHDQRRLRQAAGAGPGDVDDDAGGRQARQPEDRAADLPAPTPMGQYHEQGRAAEQATAATAAVVRKAPPAYRSLVEAYFQRVARDQATRSP